MSDTPATADRPSVIGVDWWSKGWVGVALTPGVTPDVLLDTDLATLIGRVPDAVCVAVDMPIGLPTGERAADSLARTFVGPRRNSVFSTPPAGVLDAPSYEEANLIASKVLGKKISRQAWALRESIARVAPVAAQDARIIEVHPEVSFRALVGEPLQFAKTSWNGQMIRRQRLATAGIELPDVLADITGAVPVADVLDAAVAAWSARRYATGQAESLPAASDPGQREVIWY